MVFGNPKPITIRGKYDAAAVQRMLDLLKASPLPDQVPINSEPWKLGTDLAWLKKLKARFETAWSWEKLEEEIARYDQYTVHYEDGEDTLDLHYSHVKSARSDAIPLLLVHGWPGTCFDYLRVIEALVNPPSNDLPAFHVVIPSLPGYFLSTLPPRDGWSLVNTAHIFNGLMSEVLGYTTYAGHGGDWGSHILRVMGTLFPESLPVIHFIMFLVYKQTQDQSKYTPAEEQLVTRQKNFYQFGAGYGLIQGTKPLTIGLAIGASPLALLTYIGEKLHDWLDTERLDEDYILNTVALYYLSGCFPSSVIIYNQSKPEMDGVVVTPSGWVPKGKIGFSAFPYEISAAPKSELVALGNIVYYREHSSGGHFPQVDSPKDLITDLREFFGEHWA